MKVSKSAQTMMFTFLSVKRVTFDRLTSSGSALIAFIGNNFATVDISLQASKVVNLFSEVTNWISDSAMRLKIYRGFAKQANALLTQGLQIGTAFRDLSYVTASISSHCLALTSN